MTDGSLAPERFCIYEDTSESFQERSFAVDHVLDSRPPEERGSSEERRAPESLGVGPIGPTV